MDGIKIPFLETVKYLKVTLDNKISWKPHIENKTVACKKLMVMPNSNLRAKTKIIKMGVHWRCGAKTYIRLYHQGKVNKHSAADEKIKGSG